MTRSRILHKLFLLNPPIGSWYYWLCSDDWTASRWNWDQNSWEIFKHRTADYCVNRGRNLQSGPVNICFILHYPLCISSPINLLKSHYWMLRKARRKASWAFVGREDLKKLLLWIPSKMSVEHRWRTVVVLFFWTRMTDTKIHSFILVSGG